MAVNLKGRDLISLQDYSEEEIWQILKTAEYLKMLQKSGGKWRPLEGKTLGMLFTKPSTRTRVSFEVAIYQLGGYGLFLTGNELQLRRGEAIADTARVLSRYLDGLMIRTYDHDEVIDLAHYADIPIINGLTDLVHPTQVLADFFTLYEKKGHLRGLKLAYIGDGNNVTHSLMFGAAKVGIDLSVATPEGYEPNEEVVKVARRDAEESGASIELFHDPWEAVRGADAVYTDVWASMGQEEEHAERVKVFQPYQVNEELMAAAKGNALFLHCLPAHRGEEVTDEVIDGDQSVVFDEAENRLHVHKAILALLL